MEKQLPFEDILKLLKSEKEFLRREFGVINIGLFGSYVRGKQKFDSDIDLLVELREPRFDFISGLQIYLEGRLGKPVDLVRKRKGMSERFLKRIEDDIYYA
jgi:predicted nucleotidyltransferase